MANYFKEEAKKEFKGLMSEMLSNPPPELMQQLAMASAMSVQQMTTPQMQIIPAAQTPASTEGTTIPSSVTSTGNKVRYPVDDITRPVACTLVIRYGINNQRTKKVATGLAIPGRKFHGNDIPEEYCRVEVTTVVQGCEDDMLDIPGPEGIETLGQAIKNFILWPRRDVELVDWSNSSQAQPSPPSQIVVPIVHPSSPPQTSHAAPHPLSDPPSPHPHGGPPSPPYTSPFRDPPSPQPSPRPSKKSKVSIPKLVSPFEKKKKSKSTAGTVRFLKGIGRSLTSDTVDLADLEESAKKVEAMAAKIKKPTKADYKNVPKKYVPGRPLLTFEKLRKVPANIKRLHDWYMRASSVGIDTISVNIPAHAFIGSNQKVVVTFEDMWLMMNLQRLDVQLVTIFALMQHDQQEILYGTNPNASASKRVGYLNPIKICEDNHTFRIGKGNEALQGLTDEEIEVRIQDLKKDFEARYATYIGHAMLQFQDRESIVAPYNFKDHWICFFIYPKVGKVLVLDSLHTEPSAYSKFLSILEL
uniref:DUF8039 domain-containing protein n=1 Tax=Zea mays TaxID=4577 RepID=A0A804UJ78_MAIZE